MFRSILILSALVFLAVFSSCQKQDEKQAFVPPDSETRKDPDRERLEREEFERLKKLESGDSASAADTVSAGVDSTAVTDSDSAKSLDQMKDKQEKKKLVQKEKELNKRLDNPTVAVTDYLEFLKRATSGSGNFESNIRKADSQWEKSNIGRFERNYKDTKKIVVVNEPKIVSQKDGNAVVDVRIRKTDVKDGKEVVSDMTVRYVLVADSKGKWKIRENTVTNK